jgi:DNA-binding beta-propeller fold protein YncE
LIADWGSRKLLVISPQGQIVWSYQPQASYLQALNPDSAFFTSSGKQIVIAEESHSKVVVLTVAGKKLFYTFGHYDKSGKGENYLDDPSSAIEEAGEVLVSDLVNCRVIAVKPPSHAIVTSIGHAGACKHDPPNKLDQPWSAYPLSDGGTVITELGDGRVDLLNAAGKLAASFTVAGLGHPVNVNETRSGDLIGVDHTNPGAVVIFTDTGQVLWTYRERTGDGALLDPAIAYVLPDGDVLVSDEYNDRVIVIDRKSKRIVWQYGRRHVAGGGKGYLDVPVGLDLVPPHSLLDQFPRATPPR